MTEHDSSFVLLGILYSTGAILLLVVSYIYYIRRFKKSKMEAISKIVFNTSQYDIFKMKTQFLIELSEDMFITLKLLNQNEEEIDVLLKDNLVEGQNVVDFDPTIRENGIYYLSLVAENTSILRKIRIMKS